MRKKVSARKRLGKRAKVGIASNYISHGRIKRGDKVVLVCRVSTHAQGQAGNLVRQEEYLRRQMAESRAIVVAVVSREISGFDPWWLAAAAHVAMKHEAKLVAHSTDRFIRHPDYHSVNNWTALARDEDLQGLKQWTEGVELVTLIPPDAYPKYVKAQQIKRGQGSDRKGGRPKINKLGYKKEIRKLNRPKVFFMRLAGMSVRKISKQLGVSYSTVLDWNNRIFEG